MFLLQPFLASYQTGCHHWVAPMVLQVVNEAIENTDVNIGLDNNGQLQVAVLPKDQQKVKIKRYVSHMTGVIYTKDQCWN